jgi:hypothetical protein
MTATQQCTVTVSVTATVTVNGGALPMNVANNPTTTSFTGVFAPEQFPPSLAWFWSPFCADPASNVAFTVAAGGQSVSVPADDRTCADFGGHSQISFLPGVGGGDFIVGMAPTPTGLGYWQASAYGATFPNGDAGDLFNLSHHNSPVVGIAATPTGHGFWTAGSDGGIFTTGDAAFFGSTGNIHLNQPVVGMASTPTGHGYWLVASDGGIFTFGDAAFFGSTGNIHLNQPVVGMASTPTGHGYWLVADDGGIFTFGDAHFFGAARF